MKKMMIMTLLLLCGAVQQSFAHAFWIETAATGKKGQQQQVKIYFADLGFPAETLGSEEELTVQGFKLFLLGPDQKITPLSYEPAADYYSAVFTPKEDGLYTIVLRQENVEVMSFPEMGTLKPQFYSQAFVQVGKSKGPVKLGAIKEINKMSVYAPDVKKGVETQVLVNLPELHGAKVKLTFRSPSGQEKQFILTDDNAPVFMPQESGTYQLEAQLVEHAEGTYQDQAYQAVFNAATALLQVKP